MDEEELQEQSTAVQTETEVSVDLENKAEDLPRLEDLVKSEKQVKVSTNTQIEGVTQLEQQTKPVDRVFKKKSDERKVHFKRRLKIVTAVYCSVVALLLGFVITNVVTLAMLDKKIDTNTKTIQSNQQQVELLKENQVTAGADLPISLNEPRDYSEDKQELTFLDKLTILFRNLFA